MPKKGSSPAGTTTTVQTNPTQQAQLPFLQGGWQRAADLAQNNPYQYYPGTTYQPDANIGQGYTDILDAAQGQQRTANLGDSVFASAAQGGMGIYGSPAYSGLSGLASGNNASFMRAGSFGDQLGYVGNGALGNAANYGGEINGLASMAPGAVAGNVSYLNSLSPTALATAGGFAGTTGALAGMAPGAVSGAANSLYGLGDSTSRGASGAAGVVSNIASGIPGSVSGTTGALGNFGAAAAGAGQGYGRALTGAAYAAPGAVSPATSMLLGGAMRAGADPALAPLSAEANGAFLGSNPYLAGQFQAASDPVTRAYMTATAPQTDSNYEAAGRYGSGALANARSQNELNLGDTLGNLASNLYGQDYANERGLMTQAGSALGNLYLGGVNAGTSAAGAAGNLALGGVNALQSGIRSAADATNSGFATGGGLLQQGGALSLSALNAALQGQEAAGNLGIAGNTAAGGLFSSGANTALSGLNTGISGTVAAGNIANQGFGTAGNLSQAGANTALSGLNTGITGATNAGNVANSALNTGISAFGAGGALDINRLTAQQNALNTLQSGYQSGNTAALQGLALEPSVLKSELSPGEATLQAGQGFTGLNQASIADQMSRFYGNQNAPWQNLSQFLNAIGQPTQGSASTTSPYFTNPAAGLLGGALGANQLLGSNGLFGSSGGLGSLFGSPATSFATNAAGQAVPLGSIDAIDAGGSSASGIGGKLLSLFA